MKMYLQEHTEASMEGSFALRVHTAVLTVVMSESLRYGFFCLCFSVFCKFKFDLHFLLLLLCIFQFLYSKYVFLLQSEISFLKEFTVFKLMCFGGDPLASIFSRANQAPEVGRQLLDGFLSSEWFFPYALTCRCLLLAPGIFFLSTTDLPWTPVKVFLLFSLLFHLPCLDFTLNVQTVLFLCAWV